MEMAGSKDFFFRAQLSEADPAVAQLVDLEAERQMRKIILIASESLCPLPVRQALASEYVNIYAEGYPSTRMSRWESDDLDDHARHLAFFRRYADRRYYKGTEYTDFVESLAIRRCQEIFATDEVGAEDIYVNVQPLSGAAANNAVYEAFVPHGGTVMGMALPHGGHLTHGSELNRSGKTYRIVAYEVNTKTGRIDYDRIKALAEEVDPAMIVAGYSAYPWAVDWRKFREAADAAPSGAVLFADVAHTAGLIAGGAYPSPVGYADVVAFTTHKTLCGPRGAVILTTDPAAARLVDAAVFPGEQGGPHIHTIAAKAVSFSLAATEDFQELSRRTVENAKALAEGFRKRGIPLAYGGTDSHLLLVDLGRIPTPGGAPLRADAVSRVLDICGITLNKNTIAGDEKALQPSGLRFGTTIVTQRGMGPAEMDTIADIVARLLGGMRAFEVIGLGGPVGRVRVPLDLLEETRRSIASLVAKSASWKIRPGGGYPHFGPPLPGCREPAREVSGFDRETQAVESGCALFDNSDCGHILVRGERAAALLHAVCTADVISMQPGNTATTLILDGEARVRYTLLLARFPDDEETGEPRYLLRTGPGACESLLLHLRALSDGYADLGLGDDTLKVEGPVVVEDLMARRLKNWTSLTLAGPEAFEAVCKAAPGTEELKPQTLSRLPLDEAESWIFTDRSATAHLFVETLGLHALKTALVAAGAVESGARARDAWLEKQGMLPPVEPHPEADAYIEKHRHLTVDLRKTFFIGQAALLRTAPTQEMLEPFAQGGDAGQVRRTPLYETHVESGGKMVPFAGWEMPVVYTSIGEEHAAVRGTAGLFDVGHMGVFEASGPWACRFLDLVTTNYVPRLRPGESQYAYLLAPDGSVIDDVMVYFVAPETYMIVVNAANAETDWAWLSAVNDRRCLIDPANPGARVENPCRLRNLKDSSSGPDMKIDIALQGPCSLSILLDAADTETAGALSILGKSNNIRGRIGGIDVIVSRTGYTGEEYGYEVYVHPDRADALWQALCESGEAWGMRTTGLGARDSTRTEAGLPLYGHELAGPYDVDPLEAGYGFFVKWHKPFFVGRSALLGRAGNPKRSVIRFEASGTGTRLAKTKDPVINRKDRTIGYVTSCALAGERQVGMAVVDRRQALPGSRIGFFSLPRKGESPKEKPRDRLDTGDSVTVPVPAKIIERFPGP
jgi:glycine cleavage system T protein